MKKTAFCARGLAALAAAFVLTAGAAEAQVDISGARGIPNAAPVGPAPGAGWGAPAGRPPGPQAVRPPAPPPVAGPQYGAPRPPRPHVQPGGAQPGYPAPQPQWGGHQPRRWNNPGYGGAPYWGPTVGAPVVVAPSAPYVDEDDGGYGEFCATRVRTCRLIEPAPLDSDCSCRVRGRRVWGYVR